MHSRSEFHILEDWEGEIVALDTESFMAHLIPTDKNILLDATVRFDLAEIQDELMRKRLRLHGTLRWIHGTHDQVTYDIFDVNPAPGEVPVTNPMVPSLGELAQTSQVAKDF